MSAVLDESAQPTEPVGEELSELERRTAMLRRQQEWRWQQEVRDAVAAVLAKHGAILVAQVTYLPDGRSQTGLIPMRDPRAQKTNGGAS